MSLTSVTDADEISVANDPQTIIKTGTKAPFTGVLVPYDLFRQYQVNDFESNILRNRAESCEKTVDELKTPPNIIQPIWFIGGFLLGALAMKELKY